MTVDGLREEAVRGAVRLSQRWKVQEAEKRWHPTTEASSSGSASTVEATPEGLAGEIAATRKKLEQVLQKPTMAAADMAGGSLCPRVLALERDNAEMRTELAELRQIVQQLQNELEQVKGTQTKEEKAEKVTAPTQKEEQKKEDEEDEEIDLFGSDDEQEDEEKGHPSLALERTILSAARATSEPCFGN